MCCASANATGVPARKFPVERGFRRQAFASATTICLAAGAQSSSPQAHDPVGHIITVVCAAQIGDGTDSIAVNCIGSEILGCDYRWCAAVRPQAMRGPNMMMLRPKRQPPAPIASQRSGRMRSTIHSQAMAAPTYTPP